MTTDFRALCAELVNELHNAIRVIYREDGTQHISTAEPVLQRARAQLAQPEGEEPTDEEIRRCRNEVELAHVIQDAFPLATLDAERIARAVLTRWCRPTPQSPASCPACEGAPDPSNSPCAVCGTEATLPPQPPALANIHYEWELQDAKGDWQARNSANSLNDVRREGTRYLRTYTQDGPHKLIIRQHTTQTIDEMTNG